MFAHKIVQKLLDKTVLLAFYICGNFHIKASIT